MLLSACFLVLCLQLGDHLVFYRTICIVSEVPVSVVTTLSGDHLFKVVLK